MMTKGKQSLTPEKLKRLAKLTALLPREYFDNIKAQWNLPFSSTQ